MHAHGDERDEAGDDAADHRRDARPDQADEMIVRWPYLSPEIAARELGEHVAREEQAADQAAERVRVLDVGEEADVVLDHPGDDRSGEGAVGGADGPSEQEEHPQRPVSGPGAHADSAYPANDLNDQTFSSGS